MSRWWYHSHEQVSSHDCYPISTFLHHIIIHSIAGFSMHILSSHNIISHNYTNRLCCVVNESIGVHGLERAWHTIAVAVSHQLHWLTVWCDCWWIVVSHPIMLCTIFCIIGALSMITYLVTYIVPMFFSEQNLKVSLVFSYHQSVRITLYSLLNEWSNRPNIRLNGLLLQVHRLVLVAH